ncbi:MAG: hypothetical protein NW203_10340 [Hyphomonadaceae bacterium]|jgi:hypothetical protein|nr:hypothetical protein [Hyphomonadaceae bacterium]
MSANTLFILELIIFNGVVLAWAGYEFWSVRRKPKPSPPKDEPGHPER